MSRGFLVSHCVPLLAATGMIFVSCSKRATDVAPREAPLEKHAVDPVNAASGEEADRLAAHPDDPSRPPAIKGISDDQLAASDLEKAAAACIEAIQKNPDEARYRFELGRVLLLGGLADEARTQLETAASMGHGGASFYLAVLTDDASKAKELIEKASAANFKPAQDAIAELASAREQGPTPSPDPTEELADAASPEEKVCGLEWHVLGLITDVPLELRGSVAAEVEAIMQSDQKVLSCSYWDGHATQTFNFWYEKTPADLKKITDRVQKHPLLPLGFKAVAKAPPTVEEAAEVSRASQGAVE
jgi:tetratricopeptide (TPR) repeat protein